MTYYGDMMKYVGGYYRFIFQTIWASASLESRRTSLHIHQLTSQQDKTSIHQWCPVVLIYWTTLCGQKYVDNLTESVVSAFDPLSQIIGKEMTLLILRSLWRNLSIFVFIFSCDCNV